VIQVTYISEATSKLGPGDLFRIIETSTKNNLRDDLTGFLVFLNRQFFQVIEGPQDAIDALLIRLQSDPRHTCIKIIDERSIDARAFPAWRMKRLQNGATTPPILDQLPELQTDHPAIHTALSEFLESASLHEC